VLHKIRPDEHGPLGQPMANAVQACVHCGFCLAACPTYRELGQEMDTPRGRIVLMKQVLEGDLPLADALPHVDRCLGCLACEPACPSGVAYRDLLSPFRALAEKKRRRPFMERVRRWLVSATLPHPARFRIAALAGRFAREFAPIFPKSFRPMLGLIPDRVPPRQTWPEVTPAQGRRRARVALLAGCAQQVIEPDINTATIEVLTRNGVEVVIPRAQVCCGALAWHIGDLPSAQRFARQNLRAFPADVDAILTNAAGCGSGLHEYHLILAGTELADAAGQFRHRVLDVSVFLARLGSLAPIPDPGRTLRIAYQDACHLLNAQGVRDEPRDLLRAIPRAGIVEPADAHLCCGSAGTYNMDQPEIAAHLGAAKARAIVETGADLVATGNIGCLTQLSLHLARQRAPMPIRHTMQILRDAYAGALARPS
jgi:glycolate oxidase iron-sulfur subunit